MGDISDFGRDSVAPSPADRRRQTILRIAEELFDDTGYQTTSMNDIADAVGLRKPTLYHYFSTKAELLYWIHEDYVSGLIASAKSIEDDDPASVVRTMMVQMLSAIRARGGKVRAYMEHYRDLDPDSLELMRKKRNEYRLLLESAIQRGIDAGVFRDVDARLATMAVIGATSWSYQWYERWTDESETDLAAGFADIMFHGLLAGPGTPTA